jgi:hypothetical protein
VAQLRLVRSNASGVLSDDHLAQRDYRSRRQATAVGDACTRDFNSGRRATRERVHAAHTVSFHRAPNPRERHISIVCLVANRLGEIDTSRAKHRLWNSRHDCYRYIEAMAIQTGRIARVSRSSQSLGHNRSSSSRYLRRTFRPNRSMKPTAPLQSNFSELATAPCRGLSLSR